MGLKDGVHIALDTEFSGQSWKQLFAISMAVSYYVQPEDREGLETDKKGYVNAYHTWTFPEIDLKEDESSYIWWHSDPERMAYYNTAHNTKSDAASVAMGIDSLMETIYAMDKPVYFWGDVPMLDYGRVNSLLTEYGYREMHYGPKPGAPMRTFNYKTLLLALGHIGINKKASKGFDHFGLQQLPKQQNHDPHADIQAIMGEVKMVIDVHEQLKNA